jgi:hypothetical protein
MLPSLVGRPLHSSVSVIARAMTPRQLPVLASVHCSIPDASPLLGLELEQDVVCRSTVQGAGDPHQWNGKLKRSVR